MADINIVKKFPSLLTLLVLELVLFLLISYQLRGAKRVSPLERIALGIFGPVQAATHNVVGKISSVLEIEHSREELLAENKQLKTEVSGAAQLRAQLEESQRETERLRHLLNLTPVDGWDMIPAQVIGRVQRRNDYMITINKGTRAGLEPDMGVYCEQGVVGIVWEASDNYAKVMTANNPSSVIAALIQDSRYQESFVTGYDLLNGKLDNFPNFESIKNGDLILTSGLDEIYPKGLQIGHVIKSHPSSYLFQEVLLRFATDFSRLEEVVVLKNRCQETP